MTKHICTKTIHPEVVDKARDCTCQTTIGLMSDFLKVLAVPSRLKIVSALLVSEMCVCDLAHLLLMEHSAVSHQLAVLKQANIVKSRKDGKIIYYSPADKHIGMFMDMLKEHIGESARLCNCIDTAQSCHCQED